MYNKIYHICIIVNNVFIIHRKMNAFKNLYETPKENFCQPLEIETFYWNVYQHMNLLIQVRVTQKKLQNLLMMNILELALNGE